VHVDPLQPLRGIFFQPAVERLGRFKRQSKRIARRDGRPERQRQIIDQDVDIGRVQPAVAQRPVQHQQRPPVPEGQVHQRDRRRPVFADPHLQLRIAPRAHPANTFRRRAVPFNKRAINRHTFTSW
jgi:hypothetical protein